MANKAISELPQAQNVNNQDLFVLEQGGLAKKLTAETFITEQGIIDALAEALDGHGGIQSVTLSSVSGRIRTYRITFTDQSATTFQVYDGTSIERISRTSSSGLDDVYTVFLSDGTTTFFTVHNGADGTVSEAMLNDALKNKAPAITETTESGVIANFTDGADDMVMHHVIAEINPVQDLSNGDPSPSNICPITGWTGVNVTRTGKNLLDASSLVFTSGIRNDSGAQTASANSHYSSEISVKGNTTYTLSGLLMITGTAYRVYFLTNTKGWISRTAQLSSESYTFTTNAECGYIQIQCANTIDLTEAMLELGSTATSYEPYQGNTVTLSWQTEVGTVYGGTIDVATGLLTVDMKYDQMTYAWLSTRPSADIGYNANVPLFGGPAVWVRNWNYADYPSIIAGGIKAVCNAFPISMHNRDLSSTQYRVYFGVGSMTSVDEFLSAVQTLEANGDGLWIAHEIATPQTYQLTGQQLMTLLGTNNVWADTGNVSVTYPADTKMYIEKLTIPSEDDMVANQAITSGKYFMIGNSLYLALANIASGAQITIGTNAQRVSLADALNNINS